jgi:hypothetical protein
MHVLVREVYEQGVRSAPEVYVKYMRDVHDVLKCMRSMWEVCKQCAYST